MHNEINIETIKEFGYKINNNFYKRTDMSENMLLGELKYLNVKYKHKRINHIFFN